MKKTITCIVTAVFVMGLAGYGNTTIIKSLTGLPSPAATIEFDEFGITVDTVITNQYESLGATFSPNLYQSYNPSTTNDYLTNYLSTGAITDPFYIEFTQVQSSAAFIMATGISDSSFIGTFLDGNLIELVSLYTTTAPLWYVFSGYEFDKIGVNIGGNDLMALDRLQMNPVPEPATMLLLGTGLVGVAGAARRRKKKNQA